MTRSLHSRRGTALPRRGVAFVWLVGLWLCLGAQLADLLHFALVQHSVCVAHGELTHGATQAHPGAVAALGSPSGVSEALAANADTDASHEHCVPATDRRAAFVLPCTLFVAEAAQFESAVVLAPRERLESQAELFRVAPKQSPPA